MNYKQALEQYNKELKEREQKITDAVNKAKQELTEASEKSYKDAKASENRQNEAPCSVCGKKEFILKYRDVSGSIHGETHGSFSLFGGSINGYLDGETHTSPVLCCRNCQNERRIVINDWDSEDDIWNEQLPVVFNDSIFTDYPPKEWLKSLGLEVALKIDEGKYHEYDTRDLSQISERRLSELGLKRKYSLPQKPKWYDYIFNYLSS